MAQPLELHQGVAPTFSEVLPLFLLPGGHLPSPRLAVLPGSYLSTCLDSWHSDRASDTFGRLGANHSLCLGSFPEGLKHEGGGV